MSVKVDDGKLLVHCFAGCPQDEVIEVLRERGFWPESERFNSPVQLRPSPFTLTKHPYYAASGELIAFHVRKDFGNGRKSMPWEWPDGRTANGDLQVAKLPLYGLPALVERRDKSVVLVEGEKAADAAMAEGMVAVSFGGGASQPDFGEAIESLRGRDVYLWPDNDKQGLDLMRRVEEALHGVAQRVRWLVVPGLPIKGDAADYFASGRTVEDLYGYVSDVPPGHVEDVPAPERRFKLLTAAELRNRPDPEWIVDGVIQQDTLALIVGAQETYKSFIALDMALSIAEGHPWQGLKCKQGPTVYVSAEGGSGVGLRVSAWEAARETTSRHCLFLPDQAPQFLDGRNGGDVEELLLSLSDLEEQPALIVVDTLARVMVGHDENSVEDVGLLVATADRIRQITGATVVFIHHNNKQGSARGSTALTGAVHTIIECSREQNSSHVVVKCGKQKDADHFATMILEAHVVDLGVNETTGRDRSSLILDARVTPLLQLFQQPKISEPGLQALAVVQKRETVHFAEWRDEAKLAKTTFLNARKELINGRYVEHLPEGIYRVTDLGRVQGPRGSKQGPTDQVGPWVQEGVQEGPNGSTREGPLKGRAPVDPWTLGPLDPDPHGLTEPA